MEEAKIVLDVYQEENLMTSVLEKFGLARLVQIGRRLHLQGYVVKVCTKKLERRQFCLLTDILIYSDDLYRNTKIIPMMGTSIDLIDNYKQDNPKFLEWTHAFRINSAVKSFIILTTTLGEREEFVRCLNHVIGIQAPLQLSKVPVWQRYAETPQCTNCLVLFTFFSRRHHCRQCGKVFCEQCLQFNAIVSVFSNKLVRICTCCHKNNIAPPEPKTKSSKIHKGLTRVTRRADEFRKRGFFKCFSQGRGVPVG